MRLLSSVSKGTAPSYESPPASSSAWTAMPGFGAAALFSYSPTARPEDDENAAGGSSSTSSGGVNYSDNV